MILFCDLDGVVWLAHQPIAGSVKALQRWRDAGHLAIFVTNNSYNTIAEQEGFLQTIGFDATNCVVSSATATGHLITAGDRILVAGGPGIVEAASASGATVWSAHDLVGAVARDEQRVPEFDRVIVGFDRSFDYKVLQVAVEAIRTGAKLIGTNHDPTYPTPDGPIPGGGALVAAVAYAAESVPEFAGKPNRAMAEVVLDKARELLGQVPQADQLVVVGDRIDTDGQFAQTLGVRFALVMSGVTKSAPEGINSYRDLVHLVDVLLAERPPEQ